MKGKHAQKNFGTVGAMAPTPLFLRIPGLGEGLGGVTYKDRARPPPHVSLLLLELLLMLLLAGRHRSGCSMLLSTMGMCNSFACLMD